MLEKDLQDIGLNEKEAKVYLASLELGKSTVQEIAKKANINRPTAYFVIENLMKLGLMSSFHQGKKQYFMASEPSKLKTILESKKIELLEHEERLTKIIPKLRSLNIQSEGAPVVRYYEGVEGLRSMYDEFISNGDNNDIDIIYSNDRLLNTLTSDEKNNARNIRLEKDIKANVIYTYKEGNLKTQNADTIRLPADDFPLSCDVGLYSNKIRIASLGERVTGIMIEDEEIYKTFKTIFKLAWEGAKKYRKE